MSEEEDVAGGTVILRIEVRRRDQRLLVVVALHFGRKFKNSNLFLLLVNVVLARRLPISMNVNFVELDFKFFGNLKLKFT